VESNQGEWNGSVSAKERLCVLLSVISRFD